MLIGSRSTAAIVLALCAATGVTVTAAGCGGTPAASASPPGAKAGKTRPPVPADVVSCLNGHGMSVPAGATAKQVESDLSAMPAGQQQSVYFACSSLLPAKLRQKIQARLTATPSAS